MNREEIAKRIKELLSNQLGLDVEDISEEASFVADYDADSLDAVEIIMETEDVFNLMITDEEVDMIMTVKSLIDYVEKNIADDMP